MTKQMIVTIMQCECKNIQALYIFKQNNTTQDNLQKDKCDGATARCVESHGKDQQSQRPMSS